MSRRFTALKPQLNRIRAWAHEGSTDAWIAHQLETTAEAVRAFRQEHGIERGGPAPLAPITPDSVVEAMLAEEEARGRGRGARARRRAPPRADRRRRAAERGAHARRAAARAARRRAPPRMPRRPGSSPADEDGAAEAAPAADAPARSSRSRGSRGGAGRRRLPPPPQRRPPSRRSPRPRTARRRARTSRARSASARKRGRRRGRGRGAGRGLEARLLPGSVLLLDPSVTADAAFQEHWQDAGPLRVEISADAIVLRRVAADGRARPLAGLSSRSLRALRPRTRS